jgi:hypothetical protein
MHGSISGALLITDDTGIQASYSYTFAASLPLSFGTEGALDDGTPDEEYWAISDDFTMQSSLKLKSRWH